MRRELCLLIFTFLLALTLLIPNIAPGQTYTVLYTFHGGSDGEIAYSSLIQDQQGNLFGTTPNGGTGYGTVYKLDSTGVETVLYSFGARGDAFFPYEGVIRDSSGNLYGTTAYGGTSGVGAVFKVSPAGKEKVLHSFKKDGNGFLPQAPLIMDAAGNLYGTTTNSNTHESGTVFELAPTGSYTVLHNFSGPDGAQPDGALTRDSTGNIYGTTSGGGVFNQGTVFMLDSTGTETVLYNFSGSDGSNPRSKVIRDTAGNLYGTTYFGGVGWGVVWELDANGIETVLYTFTGGADGALPAGKLIRDSTGTLYGTTSSGGDLACNAPYGCGIVFKLDTAGTETVLYRFAGGQDGAYPEGGVIRDAAGNLYGTASQGGDLTCFAPSGCGVVFKITP